MSSLRARQHSKSDIPKLVVLIIVILAFLRWTNPSTSFQSIIYPNNHPTKALIMASTTAADLSWLSEVPPEWTQHIYLTDDPEASLTVPINKGNEAMVYLTFIIDNYPSLPDIIFFHHDHYQAWHQPFSTPFELSNIRTSWVQESGYVSTRCLKNCENIIELSNSTVPLSEISLADRPEQIASLIRDFLGEKIDIPGKIAAPCCAQFAASKEAVLARPIEFWEGVREWLIDTNLESRKSGRLLEWTWHLWFGKEAEFCPEYDQCMCNVLGLGNCT